MTLDQRFTLEAAGLLFLIHCDDPQLAQIIEANTQGFWTVSPAVDDYAFKISIETSLDPHDGSAQRSNDLLFGYGENAIHGQIIENPNCRRALCASDHMQLACVDPRELTMCVKTRGLGTFIALYRVISTILRDQIIEANGFEMHASAVTDGSQIVAFVGKKGAGKTSLCMDFLLSQNWGFVANDHVFVLPDALANGLPVIIALPETLRIGDGTLRQHARLSELAQAENRQPSADGKTRIFVSELAGMLDAKPPISARGTLHSVVLCDFSQGLPKGGVLKSSAVNETILAPHILAKANYKRPAWLAWIDIPKIKQNSGRDNFAKVSAFEFQRSKGDSYAALRLSRAIAGFVA